nr:hypothetical protein [Micromonospora sp. DSM 115978]
MLDVEHRAGGWRTEVKVQVADGMTGHSEPIGDVATRDRATSAAFVGRREDDHNVDPPGPWRAVVS